MRQAGVIAVLLVVLVSGLFFVHGIQDWFVHHAIPLQREAQNALAGALRSLRAGQPGAVTGFLLLCFSHGFLHALGPGHGKAVIAAYGAAAPSSLRWLMALAALSSLAQATVAVALVYAAVWLLDGARDRVEGLATMIEPFSFAIIALLGLMLVRRGAGRLIRIFARKRPTGHHHHVHGPDCGCGHSHAPDPAALAAARDRREAVALILGVALRPCTSALFLLILTWRLDLELLGVLGAFVMGLGTMTVTVSAGLAAALLRRGMFLALPEGRSLAPAVALSELLLGALIAMLAGGMVLRLI
ncbi:high frequency lysogenization protein HflD [Sinirhodobacter populi]|uniref:Nickel/cobalt efflux system n=1 Tax=Paenirhodobacter populi TaxID=2306993 RepID=A0A443IL71_9RHOB|nr:high frequency lysogenization protein HflD [Sinirhodobacter populi]RWR27554.1 high frequency lysogenization protein HflD [Sinirhodobacter populi]